MNLFLMRHGQAFSVLEDPNRGLTSQGRTDVAQVVERSPLLPGDIDHIVHSGVCRTEQTAGIVANMLGVNHVVSNFSGLAESADIDWCVMMLSAWDRNTLLVSHQPLLMALLDYLVPQQAGEVGFFATATLVCLEKNQQGGWSLVWWRSPEPSWVD